MKILYTRFEPIDLEQPERCQMIIKYADGTEEVTIDEVRMQEIEWQLFRQQHGVMQ